MVHNEIARDSENRLFWTVMSSGLHRNDCTHEEIRKKKMKKYIQRDAVLENSDRKNDKIAEIINLKLEEVGLEEMKYD